MIVIDVKKRNGDIVPFDFHKIENAVKGAFDELNEPLPQYVLDNLLDGAELEFENQELVDVEQIQDYVEDMLLGMDFWEVAKAYIKYRHEHDLMRQSNTTDQTIKELLDGNNEYWNKENSNKNPRVLHTQRDYIAGITSTDITRRFLLPKDVVKAHDEGIIHFHDADYFAQKSIHNCELINLEDMLQNGTMINGVMIDKPHRIITAATIATQIISAVTSSSYGGASISLTHLAPFVRSSYKQYKDKYTSWGFDDKKASEFAEKDTRKEVKDAVQTFLYQTNSMTNTNGQAPFLSVFMYLGETQEYKKELAMLIEEFLNQRILGFKNSSGVYVAPAFPKYLYVLEEDNISEDSPYWYLSELAAECVTKRMVPDFISEKIMRAQKLTPSETEGNGDCYPCMGCRSFLTPDQTENGFDNIAKAKNWKPGEHKYYGRFNQGVVTINLPDVALSARKMAQEYLNSYNPNQDQIEEYFWDIFENRLELCHKALKIRHKRLAEVTSDVAPILWQYGALARLEPGESIHPLLHNSYSTLSLGYAGVYEATKVVTGYSHTDKQHGGHDFAIRMMQKMNDKCNEWKKSENIGYSLYGSPIESTTYKFAKCLKQRFGIVPEITDKDYITNSYHVNVKEKIDPFEKLKFESEFQALSPGGQISYVESDSLLNNEPVVLTMMKFIYDNIMYAEINLALDRCNVCGYEGAMQTDSNYDWYCPNCGNTDQTKMNVTRRTCGYIGSHYWNKGRTEEIVERYHHIGDHELDGD